MKKMRLILGVAVAALIISMTGCGAIAAALAAPYGYVYDGRTGDPISGVTLTLTNLEDNTTKTAITGTDGYYSFSSVEYGKFELTASGGNFAYIKEPVEVSGIAQRLPNIAGIPTNIDGDTVGSGDDLISGILTFVAFWDTDFSDVDSILTFPNTNVGEETFDSNGTDFYNSIDTYTAGFFPDTTTNRFRLNKTNSVFQTGLGKNTTSGADIWLEADNNGSAGQVLGGPETITVFYPPTGLSGWVGSATYTSSGTDDSSKLPAGTYACIGVMEYYLDAASATTELASSDNTSAANPVVYIFDGTSQIARYTLPQYTDIERASVFRVNIFINSSSEYYYQILPDTKVYNDYDSSNLKSVSNELEPVVVKARSRN